MIKGASYTFLCNFEQACNNSIHLPKYPHNRFCKYILFGELNCRTLHRICLVYKTSANLFLQFIPKKVCVISDISRTAKVVFDLVDYRKKRISALD